MDLISNGNTAEIFEYDSHLICKLFYRNYPSQYAEHEFNNARAVLKSGINTPTAYKMVCIDGCVGIIYDKIDGETLLSKLSNREVQDIWLEKFVNFHKEMISKTVANVMDYKAFLKLLAGDSPELLRKIKGLEDDIRLLHGDFHPANLMVDTARNMVLIDMVNVCKGPAAYDVARTYFLLGHEKQLQRMYLEKMEFELSEIMPYFEVISSLRAKESPK